MIRIYSPIKRQIVSFLLALAAFTPTIDTLAQDPLDVAPEHYKVLFENESVRVLEARYAPGESSDFHKHPENLAVAISDGLSRPVDIEGNVTEYRFKAGDVFMREELHHIGTNSSNEDMHFVIVEFKETE